MQRLDLTALSQRASFKHFATVTLRYGDLDTVGHVNNVAFASFIEMGRVSFLGPLLDSFTDGGIDTVLARITIDYLKEVRFPGSVEVGTRIFRLGNKSATIGNAVFVGDTCHAIAECSSVFFDLKTRTSTAPPPRLRAELERLVCE